MNTTQSTPLMSKKHIDNISKLYGCSREKAHQIFNAGKPVRKSRNR